MAQAWLPTKGALDLSLIYTNVLSLKHYLPSGEEVDVGSTRSDIVTLRAIYGITDRISISGSIPYVRTWYSGERPHPGHQDDGSVHDSLADWRLGLHYQLAEGPIAFAPYIQYVTPAKDYETLGHSAIGRGLNEFWLGFSAGRNLDRFLPRARIQLRYNYAFVEKVADIKHDRSNLDVELMYRLTPRWEVRGVFSYQDSYGGIEVPIPPSHPLFPYHDQLAAADEVLVGLGTSINIGVRNALHALYMESVRGTNGHKVDQNLSLAWTWSFTP